MVDFKKLLSAEARDRLEYHARERDRWLAMGDREFVEHAIHTLHNCDRSRQRKGDPVYDATMDHIVIPEMIRRLISAYAPNLVVSTRLTCPLCGSHIEG